MNRSIREILQSLLVELINRLISLCKRIQDRFGNDNNSFILVEHLGSGCLKLFPGSGILALEACGLKLEALATGLEACSLLLNELGA